MNNRILLVLILTLVASSSIYGANNKNNGAGMSNTAVSLEDNEDISTAPSSFQSGYEKKFMAPLAQSDIIEIAKQLKILQATIDALCIKSRGFTANIVSPDFYEFHSFFNLTIKYLQEASYDVAERVRSLGAMANTTIADIQQKTKILDASSVVTDPAEMVAELWKDYIVASSQARGIFRMAASIGDAGTIALATKTTNQLEHFLWELRVMTGRK
jgi:starvation-inducible DNA-binding protein